MQQKTGSNGIEFVVSINDKVLEKKIIGPYIERISFLEKLLEKRETKIYNYHKEFRNPRIAAIFGVVADEVMKPIKGSVNSKKILLLQFLYDKGIVSSDKIVKYAKDLGIKGVGYNTYVNSMHKTGLLQRDKKGYYYISDKGKEVVEYYVKNSFSLFFDLYKSNPKYKWKFDPYSKKFSEEEIEKRRDRYRKMMKPFWDNGYNVMPRNDSEKIKIVTKWMEKHKVKDEFYTKLLLKWVSKKE